jgi:fatty acid desaturase
MKRAERFQHQARRAAAVAFAFLALGTAAGCWAVAAFQSGTLPGGTALIAGAVTAFAAAVHHTREAARRHRMAATELHWDTIRSIRPRL